MLHEIYKVLEKPQSSKYGKLVQRALLINVFINIGSSLLYTFSNFNQNIKGFLLIIEYITVVIFCIELIFRYISIGNDKRYRGVLGKIKFTLTPFIIIDIISLIPYFTTGIQFDTLTARIIRFLKFFRILKLIRLKDVAKNVFSLSFFATTSIFVQFIILFTFSIFSIAAFAIVLKSIKLSVLIFLSPSAIAEISDFDQVLFGFFELILGLIIGGTLISIISSLLTNIIDDIKNGFYPYKGKDHIVIINSNPKTNFILDEINYYYADLEQTKDIVLFLPFIKDTEEFSQNLKQYSNIRIFILKGSPFVWNTYEKININHCGKIIILKENNNTNRFLESKITRYILSHEKFQNRYLKFIIESSSNRDEIIYNEIFSDNKNKSDIINSIDIILNLLNRSITNPMYFQIYSGLLSFQNWEIKIIDYKEIFNVEKSFKEAYLELGDAVILGVIKNNEVKLNVDKDITLSFEDKLIIIIKESYNYYLTEISSNHNQIIENTAIKIPKPRLKSTRNICIIGDFDDIDISKIYDFLDDESIAKLQRYTQDDNEGYLDIDFWKVIISNNFDMIILNLDDDFEFILTMYLRNKFNSNTKFLESLVNIVHDPIVSQLLHRNDIIKSNIILSEKLSGEFITQTVFNEYIVKIFEEITRAQGNEFYILDKEEYAELYNLDIFNLKSILLENDMIYIGAIVDNNFYINDNRVNKFHSIVVLTEGI
ncbi:ion transporter [Psychrobacter sp. I-STPA10]|uniref:ion transporter n=1 Tax=Psychrobacter sp. I-STPA10 TaxID=2585769 RepID=UPI001E3672A3|nr:ion transporter [Psychrobacter sp. I-STPA10]